MDALAQMTRLFAIDALVNLVVLSIMKCGTTSIFKSVLILHYAHMPFVVNYFIPITYTIQFAGLCWFIKERYSKEIVKCIHGVLLCTWTAEVVQKQKLLTYFATLFLDDFAAILLFLLNVIIFLEVLWLIQNIIKFFAILLIEVSFIAVASIGGRTK